MPSGSDASFGGTLFRHVSPDHTGLAEPALAGSSLEVTETIPIPLENWQDPRAFTPLQPARWRERRVAGAEQISGDTWSANPHAAVRRLPSPGTEANRLGDPVPVPRNR